MLRDMLILDWVVSLAMAVAVAWLLDRRRLFGVVVVVVGSVAMMALALVVGGVLFFNLRAFGAVVGTVVVWVVWDVGKSVYARLNR